MKYEVHYFGVGTLHFAQREIQPIGKYEGKKVPVFDETTTPITKGLRLMEKAGKVKVVPFQKKPPQVSVDPPEEVIVDPPEDLTEDAVGFTREELESLLVKDLDELGKDLRISGISSMRKDEKIEAILGAQ